MGLLHAFRGKAFGVASRRTANGGLTLFAHRPIAKGQPLIEVPVSSCLAHSSTSLVESASTSIPSHATRHNRTGPSPVDKRLSQLFSPGRRVVGGCTAWHPFGHFADWHRHTNGMVTGLSASTEDGKVFSLHPFEAALALSVLEGATLASPPYGTPQWHYLQTLPLGQFMYQGGDPSRRSQVVAVLAEGASEQQVSLFHDAHMCLEVIASNLADALLYKYHHTHHDEQLEWMAQAALLCMRGRVSYLPVFSKAPTHPKAVCECYRPFVVPGIDMIRHSFDVEDEVNTKLFVDLSRGCVRAEAFKNIEAGDELFVLHPMPTDETEIEGIDQSMALVLRYGIGAFI